MVTITKDLLVIKLVQQREICDNMYNYSADFILKFLIFHLHNYLLSYFWIAVVPILILYHGVFRMIYIYEWFKSTHTNWVILI